MGWFAGDEETGEQGKMVKGRLSDNEQREFGWAFLGDVWEG